MSALKYWNGSAWVQLPVGTAREVWTGPDAPIPVGDNRLWIDTDEPDPALVGSNAWYSVGSGATVANGTAWAMLPLPTVFTAQGDAAAFTRNADGSMTVRDAGIYAITGNIYTGGGTAARRQARIIRGTDVQVGSDLVVDERDCPAGATGFVGLSTVAYIPAGLTISAWTWSDVAPTGTLRSLMNFTIARLATGPQGPPGPAGPLGIEPIEALHFVGAAGEPAFTNSWVNFDAGSPPPSGTQAYANFYKDRGRVYLGGTIKGGAASTVAFTLPPGYRPRTTTGPYFVVLGGPSASAALLTVLSDGTVTPANLSGSNVNAFISLDGASFRV